MTPKRAAAAKVIPPDEVQSKRRETLFRKLDPNFDLSKTPELGREESMKLFLYRFNRIACLIPSALFVRNANEPVGFNNMTGELRAYFKTSTFEEYLHSQLERRFSSASAANRAEVLKELMSDEDIQQFNALSVSIRALYNVKERINLELFLELYNEALQIAHGTGLNDLENRKRDAKILMELM